MPLLAIALLAYLGWAAFLFVMQRGIMFPRGHLPRPSGGGVPDGVEPVELPFAAGRAEAWFLPAEAQGPSPAVIFAHGNAELIENGLLEAKSLAGLGLSVLLVEYPGYGRSDGQPSRRSIGEVFLAAYDWLAIRAEVDRERIVGMGRSLGTGAITDLVRHRPLRALILQSAFISVAHFARRFFVPGLLARDRFDNLKVLTDFSGPVLLLHGVRDEVIPYSHGVRLARASPTAELLSLDCGHNDCPPDREQYISALEGFLERAQVLSSGSRPPDRN